jgi:ABC-type Mn2+/Zn2+ transport system permease subunit
MSSLAHYLTSDFVQRAVIGVVLIAVNAALSGVFASLRSLTFLVSGASHAALAGAALAILLDVYGVAHGISPIAGGAVFAVALSLMAAYATYRGSERSADPAIGVGFALSMALAVLIISFIPQSASRVWGILLGDLLLLTAADVWLLAALTAAVSVVFWLFWRPFVFITFDMEGARAFGIRAGALNYLLFALIGISAALIMKGVGAIVVFAMLVSPAATALLVGRTVRQVVVWSFSIALVSGLVAILVSFHTRFSVSALAALLAAGSYFVAKGWLWVRGRRATGSR